MIKLLTIFLGISVAFNMTADKFLQPATLLIMGLGMLVIFVVIGIIILVTMMINKFFAD